MNLRKALFNITSFAAALIASSFAHAANQDMTPYTGNFKVKDCAYTENYVSYPKDYNCRFTEIRVTAQANNTYEVSYTDELGQKVDEIAMSDYHNDQKDGTTEQGAFAYSETNVTWTYTKTATSGPSYTDTRTFTLNADGTITYDHAISASGDSYKSADWSYTLTKE
jgi:hypothetical protein